MDSIHRAAGGGSHASCIAWRVRAETSGPNPERPNEGAALTPPMGGVPLSARITGSSPSFGQLKGGRRSLPPGLSLPALVTRTPRKGWGSSDKRSGTQNLCDL